MLVFFTWIVCGTLTAGAQHEGHGNKLSRHPSYLDVRNVPRALTSRYCGPYVVWHLLALCSKPAPLKQLINELGVDGNRGCSMADISACLRRHGLRATCVVLDFHEITGMDMPFVPFLPARKGEESGHFVAVAPAGAGRAVVLDGDREPRLIMLSALENESARAGWQGEAVVLGDASGSKVRGLFPVLALGLGCAVFAIVRHRRVRCVAA